MVRNTLPALFVVFLSIYILSFKLRHNDSLEESIQRGITVYKKQCITCHMEDGEGIPNAFPPLAKSDFLLHNDEKIIEALIFGRTGEVTVNGQTYFGEMPPSNLNDEEIADVLNYVRNSWGNEGKEITSEQVKEVRNNKSKR